MKDFRHLFNTSMQNAGMPEFYRRYLLGQSPGRSALVNYTHLNDLQQQYTRAVESIYRLLLDAVKERLHLAEASTAEPEADEESSPAPVGSFATAAN
jgi:hypothetical protein